MPAEISHLLFRPTNNRPAIPSVPGSGRKEVRLPRSSESCHDVTQVSETSLASMLLEDESYNILVF